MYKPTGAAFRGGDVRLKVCRAREAVDVVAVLLLSGARAPSMDEAHCKKPPLRVAQRMGLLAEKA